MSKGNLDIFVNTMNSNRTVDSVRYRDQSANQVAEDGWQADGAFRHKFDKPNSQQDQNKVILNEALNVPSGCSKARAYANR